MLRDYRGKAVLVTGGTLGIGLATALAFGRHGARCTLTYRWGTADEEEIRARFRAVGAPEPFLVLADVSQPEDTRALLGELQRRHDRIEAFISNATGAAVVQDVDDLTERALLQSVRYSVWPTVDYLKQIREVFGCYPRYVVAMSSTGPDTFSRGYDFVAATKAALEALCSYLTYRLRHEDICINVLRTRAVRTEAFESTFGAAIYQFARRYASDQHFIRPEEVADVALCLCSGLLDGMRGQVVAVDRGAVFIDNVNWLYSQRAVLDL
jgi:NAD(P)-dependent dehydrogenase (short-subunit alcohol dehydrogenase family)